MCMHKERLLNTLLPGQKATILRIESAFPELENRLLSLGLVKGTEIQVKNTAPFGDPISVNLRGFCLSLRKSEAQVVVVECL